MKQLLTIFGILFFTSSTFGQVTVEGTVYLDNQDPAIGANITVEGNTSIGTSTDLDGYFSLDVPSLPITLSFSYVGFISKSIFINKNSKSNLTVTLNETDGGPLITYVTITDYRLLHSANYNKLDPEDLKIGSSATVLSAMNTTPGIHIHSGALNTNRITIRGIGNRSPFATTKLRAYLDEIPLTSGVGETTIEDIDLDLLSSIKIIKGPNSSNYGSGLGGSIIMKTDHNTTEDFVSAIFEAGSYGYYRTSNAMNLSSEKSTFRINSNFTHNDGYRENNTYDRLNFSLLNKTNYSEKGKLTFLLNYTSLNAFIPSSLNEDDYLNEPTKAAFTWNKVKGFENYNKIQLGASHHIEWNKWSNTSSIFGTAYDSYESRPFNILAENSTALGARTNFNYYLPTKNNSHLIKFGAEYFNEKYDWQTYKTLDGVLGEHLGDYIENRQYFNIFAEADWKLLDESLTIETGVNLNSTQYELKDFFFLDSVGVSGDYQFNLIASPRVGINYFLWEKNISFFANASHGFSPPSLEETLTPDGAINPNIKPEQGWNYEIGSRGDLLNLDKLKYNISFYYMDVRDLLVAKRLDLDQYIGINAGRTSHLGLEIDLDYTRRLRKWIFNPFLNYHFAHYTFEEFIDEDQDYSGNELTGNIPHKINSGIKFKTNSGIYGNVIYQFVDQMPMRDDNSIYSDNYQTVDVKVGFSKSFDKYKNVENKKREFVLDIYAGIRNITNEKYASQILINAGSFGGNAPRYYYPGLPRNYYGGVSFRYLW